MPTFLTQTFLLNTYEICTYISPGNRKLIQVFYKSKYIFISLIIWHIKLINYVSQVYTIYYMTTTFKLLYKILLRVIYILNELIN